MASPDDGRSHSPPARKLSVFNGRVTVPPYGSVSLDTSRCLCHLPPTGLDQYGPVRPAPTSPPARRSHQEEHGMHRNLRRAAIAAVSAALVAAGAAGCGNDDTPA